MPGPGGDWVTPAAMASCAARSMAGGPSSSGKPWPRLTAPMRAASADISANTVVAYGRSCGTVMVVELRAPHLGPRLAHCDRTVPLGHESDRAVTLGALTCGNSPNQQVGRAPC